ncbi:tail fiber protein [Aquimarina litoralis]|uniref:tail fiber protein n=1 Tax=Aquimarina litoralis TaxID=584605 RepID=UPI001C55D8CE|nr:tail fiber protein [Aquimarina litoralis]MBW1296612.1 hypothetical protein [Aquimarina litoralis]
MKKIILLLLLISIQQVTSQNTINQNGIQTTVTNEFSANGTQARRYEIAKVGFNSHHWQRGSYMIVELFQTSFSSGYEKYIIQIGYEEGAQNTNPNIYLVEARGLRRNAKVSLGPITDLTTSRGGYINQVIPIYVDVKYYTKYKAKITYLRNKAAIVSEDNQIQIIESPTGIDIPDFTVPPFSSNSNSNERLEITASGNHYIQNGNVGIGITNPAAKLHVVGNGVRADKFSLASITDVTNESPWYGIGRGSFMNLSNNTDKASVQLAGYYGLLLKTAYGSLGIHQNGNVGIGTTNPDAKLTVKGDIHTQEVKVDLNGAVAPDYVFLEDYDLKSIEDVEAYINDQGHLPNIPSAAEMEKNGIELKQMNLQLLEKIEELTLYTIAQEKELKEAKNKLHAADSKLQNLDSKNKELEKRLAKIEALINKQ